MQLFLKQLKKIIIYSQVIRSYHSFMIGFYIKVMIFVIVEFKLIKVIILKCDHI